MAIKWFFTGTEASVLSFALLFQIQNQMNHKKAIHYAILHQNRVPLDSQVSKKESERRKKSMKTRDALLAGTVGLNVVCLSAVVAWQGAVS